MRAHTTSTLRGLHRPSTPSTTPSSCPSLSHPQLRHRSDLIRTPTRWQRFQAATQASHGPRNPLNYIDVAHFQTHRSRLLRKKILLYGAGIALCIGGQIYMVSSTWGKSNPAEDAKTRPPKQAYERLDAPPASGLEHVEGRPVVVKEKPGQPEIKLDEFGHELVPTGTSTIPFFPRNIRVPVTLIHPSSSKTDPSATPISNTPGESATSSSEEEYTLLGLGIRTVSFLSIQVYVLGLYIRTSDLGTLQEAFIKHARTNPSSSSLIPSEKETLQTALLDPEQSLQIWEKILKETGTRSCVRIVPTRGTDFNHLRDGWVRGITARTQELARNSSSAAMSREYEDESFGNAMKAFQALLSGRGKAPKGSTVLLTRDERGRLGVVYDHAGVKEVLGGLEDERVARLVWLGYLGGKNVSSEGARRSVVEGVGELVARPMGTVGLGAAAL